MSGVISKEQNDVKAKLYMNNIPSSSFFKKAQEVNEAAQIAETTGKKIR